MSIHSLKNRWLLLLFVVIYPLSAKAATPLDEIQAVQVFNTVGKLGGEESRWLGNFQVQTRMGRNNNLTQINRLFITPIVGYAITPKLTVWQGYSYTPGWNENTNDRRDEHRLFQQIVVENQWKQLSWASRTRLEERFIEQTNSTTAYRIRQQVRGQIPLSKDKKWLGVAWNEYMVNMNTVPNAAQAGYNQNAFFVGINKQLNPHINAEAGYSLQAVNRLNGADQFNHIIQVQLNYRW